MAVGLSVLLGWLALFASFAYFIDGQSASRAGEGLESVPVVGAAFKKVCGLIVMVLFFPAAWADVKVLIGIFQVVTGIRFRQVNDWWEIAPAWVKVLTTPLIVVVVMPLVLGLFLATLAPVIWVYQSIAH